MTKELKTLCILPAWNEQGKIGNVIRKVLAVEEVEAILVVDDCSSDDTRQEALDSGAQVVRHEVNKGVGAAIRTGLHYAREHGFDVAVIMSGDDQHEPRELSVVLAPLRNGSADFVQGSRRLRGGKTVNGPLFREITTRVFSLIFTVFTASRITDGTNGFRAFFLSLLDDESINIDQDWLDSYELEPYLLYKAVRMKHCTLVEVPITIYYRGEVKQYSKMRPIRDWWRLIRPLVFLRFGLRR